MRYILRQLSNTTLGYLFHVHAVFLKFNKSLGIFLSMSTCFLIFYTIFVLGNYTFHTNAELPSIQAFLTLQIVFDQYFDSLRLNWHRSCSIRLHFMYTQHIFSNPRNINHQLPLNLISLYIRICFFFFFKGQ